jgi:hypothetical protein
MAHPAVALAESALRARKLDRTLTTALPPLARSGADACAAAGIAALDAALHGGLPRGQLSEIAGPRSSGRTTLLLQLVAAATARGEIAALVDTFDRFDVASAIAADIDVDRLLWIRGQAISKTEGAIDPRWVPAEGSAGGARARGLVERAVDRALKALNLVLQAGGFAVVALDLADVPLAALRRVPYTTWLRIQRTIEATDTACVLVAPEPIARSAGGVTLALRGRTAWTGAADRSRRFAGLDIATHIVSPRRRLNADVAVGAHAHDCW